MEAEDPELLETLRRHGLQAHAHRLAPRAHAEITLEPVPGATARSRIGGSPDVPPDFGWPVQRWPLAEVATWPEWVQPQVAAALEAGQAHEEDGYLVTPLVFVAQLDLAEVRAGDPEQRLPEYGLLLFFASVATDIQAPRFSKRVAASVRWVDAPPEHRRPRAQPPATDPGPEGTCPLVVGRRVVFDLDYEEWAALLAELGEGAAALKAESARRVHALFPAPALECAGPMPPPGWVALARFEEQDEIHFFVGDASWVTFVLPGAALPARRFEQAVASVFIG